MTITQSAKQMTEETQSVTDREEIEDAEKLRKEKKLTTTIIIEAANALTALGDEDETAPESAPIATKGNSNDDDENDDKDQAVDKPTEDITSLNDMAASAAAGEQQESSFTTAAITEASTTATTTTAAVQQPQEYGCGDTVTSGGTGASASNGGIIKNNSSHSKRFLPEHKKPDAAPTFPEKVRQMISTLFSLESRGIVQSGITSLGIESNLSTWHLIWLSSFVNQNYFSTDDGVNAECGRT